MEVIEDFLQKFGDNIFEEHLEMIHTFKSEYSNYNAFNMPCPHDNSSGDVVGICGCYFFHSRKEKIMKIIEKYKNLFISINKKEKK